MRASRSWVVALVILGAAATLPARQPVAAAGRQSPGQIAQAPPPTGTGLIMGRVVEADTTTPVAGAVVSIGCVGANPPMRDRIRTDSAGRFVFFNVPAATHFLCVTKSNYAGLSKTITLSDGQKLSNVTIVIASTADVVVAGRIVDEANEPAVGVHVMLLTTYSAGSGPRFWQAGGGETDDRGEYRIRAARGPGVYIVMVPSTQAFVPASTLEAVADLRQAGRSTTEFQRELIIAGVSDGGTTTPLPTAGTRSGIAFGSDVQALSSAVRAPKTAADGRVFAYPTEFYPGTSAASQAARLTLHPGETKTGVDLQLTPVPAVHVTGVAMAPDGPAANLALRLVASDAPDFSADLDLATTVTDAVGHFTFVNVPSGDYVLRALKVPRAIAGVPTPTTTIETGAGAATMSGGPPPATVTTLPPDPALWATLPITVGLTDVKDVALTLRPGARVSGRLEFAGSAPPPTADALSRASLSIVRRDGHSIAGSMSSSSAPAPLARIDGAGNLASQGFPAGTYIFSIYTSPFPGWTFKSATVDGRDVTDAGFDLDAVDLDHVVLTFTDRPTSLTGTVRDASRNTVADVSVGVFPTDRRQWTNFGTISRHIRSARAGVDGRFSFPDLPPGEYFVLVLPSPLASDWQSSTALDALSRTAVTTQLGEGEKRTLDLTTTSGRGGQ
jgi:hypothetical protein